MTPPLPDNLNQAHQQILSLYAALQQAEEKLGQAEEKLQHSGSEIESLWQQIRILRKHLFGPKSERQVSPSADTLTPDLFGAQVPATAQEIREETRPAPAAPRRKRSSRSLPPELRRDVVPLEVPPAERLCPSCRKEMPVIGKDVTEKLEFIPATLYVKQIVRPRYACPHCKEKVVQAPLPPQPIAQGQAGPGLLAYLAVAKYADHLPLCRLERIFDRHGIDLPRARMCEWLMQMAALCGILLLTMRRKILLSHVIQADETSLQVQTGEKTGKTKKAWLWAYLGDETAPYTVYDFRLSRSRDGPREILQEFKGTLLTDAYSAYDGLSPESPDPLVPAIERAACWAHARRYFVEAQESGCTAAGEAVGLIQAMYAVEADLSKRATQQKRVLAPEEIVAERQKRAKPAMETLGQWMAARLDALPKSPLGKAVAYAQNRWKELGRYLEDGRIPIDNNASERALRPVAIGRKNWLFAGSERGGHAAATFFTLIESARRNGHNPWLYLCDLFTRLPAHPVNRIEELLPDQWKPAETPKTPKSGVADPNALKS